MALHNKAEVLTSLRPDIAIVPECAKPEIVQKKAVRFIFRMQNGSGTISTRDLEFSHLET
jgi:hypothetical protein